MKQLSILYSKDNSNRLRSWKIIVTECNDYSLIIIEFGLVNGTRILCDTEIRDGKNIGKLNSTTHIQQAEKEAKSKHRRKQQEGWTSFDDVRKFANLNGLFTTDEEYKILQDNLSINKTDINNLAKPNKAQPFKAGKMRFPAYAQPKINGVRGIVYYDSTGMFPQARIRSKEGVQYPIQHICDIFTTFYTNNSFAQNIIFDGEIDHHMAKSPSISGAARNPNNDIHKELYFTCFDIAELYISQAQRLIERDAYAILLESEPETKLVNRIDVRNVICRFLYTPTITSEEQAITFAEECIDAGYEGCIVRDISAEYAFGRKTYDMMKIKAINLNSITTEEEFYIVDVVDLGTKGGRVQIVFDLINNLEHDNTIFRCTPGDKNNKWDADRKIDTYNNRDNIIGKKALVKFGERTKYDIPFHANVIKIL